MTYHREQAEKCGITGTHITVTVDGHAEGEHDHEHDHEHHHHHSGMEEIGHLIGHLPVSEKVRADIRAVYDSIAQAESRRPRRAGGRTFTSMRWAPWTPWRT